MEFAGHWLRNTELEVGRIILSWVIEIVFYHMNWIELPQDIVCCLAALLHSALS